MLSQASLRRTVMLIVAFGLVLIALTWTAVVEQARFERRATIAAATRHTTNRAIAFEQYVTRTLEAANVAMLHLSDKHASIGGTAADPRWIDDPVVDNALFGVVSIANEKGDVVATTASPPPVNMNAAGREGFRVHVARDSGRMFIGTPREVRTVGRVLMGLSRRINNPDGSFGGVVSIQMDPGKFTDFYAQADVRPTDVMSVIGLDGITRARRTGSRSSYGEDLRGMEVMEIQARQPNGTYVGPGGLDGIVRFFSHRRLPGYPLFVTVGVGHDAVLAPLRARQDRYFVGAALLSLATISFAWLLIAGLYRRQRAGIEIAEANQRLREAHRIARIGDWDYDLRTGAVNWSPELYAMYERDPALGPPTKDEVFAYFDEQSRPVAERAVELAIETGEPQEFEMRIILPSGRASYRKTVAVPTRDLSGKVVRLHGTDQDISAAKLLEMLQAEVAHLSRIDAMNTMASTLAHELNQPLTAAKNYLVGSRRMVGGLGSEEARIVADAMQGAERQILLAADIIRRIRDMVANRGSAYECASLPDVVTDALALIAVANEYPQIRLTQRLSPDAEFVTGDRVQIQQVMINLVRNACDAASESANPAVTISSERCSGDHVKVSVTDNGPGIPASLGDLFSPFSTSKKTGLGLGLSISRTIVEAHGGRIWVESNSDAGTTMSFTIPTERLELAVAS
ncbi:ATP-binding protein [Enterovirga sp. GCM10030262]|uniref:ATP-binding protein n=1 Tax=Enterovirga sp. GCM10030262 TaxID=3273391 RepID=UPI00360C558E